jgi:hypothetical protein
MTADVLVEKNGRNPLLTPTELGILQTAVKRGAAWAPSDAQAKRILEAAKKLEDDGLT